MKTDTTNPQLDFTGERFTPENPREIWYEHFHRYALASTLVGNIDVLDAACGEGYGSALLAEHARSVTAVDISADAVTHAAQRYDDLKNLNFIQADCASLDLDEQKFDAVISFETLEHLEQQEAMLAGFRRVLKPGGWLFISSPDKAEYSDVTGYQNPFHVKELYRQELLDLLDQQFPSVRLFGQKLAFHSLIWDLQSCGDYQSQLMAAEALKNSNKLQHNPTYFLALCAASADLMPSIPALNLFADDSASVYQHYEHEIRKNMAAGGIIQQRDQQIAELEERLKALETDIPQPGLFSRWLKK